MSQIQIYKNNILLRIKDFKSLDLSKIYTRGGNYQLWNSMDDEDLEKYVQNILFLLISIESNIDIFDGSVQISFLQTLDSYILSTVNAYNNSGLININSNDITSQHHDFLNNAQNILNILWSSPYYNILSNYNKFENIPLEIKKDVLDAQIELSKFNQNKENIQEAIDSAVLWLKNKNSIQEQVIKEQAQEYLNRAKEHKIFDHQKKFLTFGFSGRYGWLLSTLFFSGIIGFITYSFFDTANSEKDISVGNALLHIVTIIVPSYLAMFSSSQFLYHKKMYEAYMFKNASLGTMNYLLQIHTDQIKTEKILSKGIDILFSEPSIKEDTGKIDKTMVTELIKLATRQ